MKPIFSIIIPNFNNANLLPRCIESCLNQTFSGIEIIIIDDCSTDNSKTIIQTYAKKYNNLKYEFLLVNSKQGTARNIGIEKCIGEYILFLDSDDYIDKETCLFLYRYINKSKIKYDIISSAGYIKSYNNTDIKIRNKINSDIVRSTGGGGINIYQRQLIIENQSLFCTKLYNRNFLNKYNLKFPEGICYEDAFFNFYSIIYADTIGYVNSFFYHYWQENESTTRNRNNIRQYERIDIAKRIINYGKQNNLDKYIDIIEYKYLQMQASNLLYICLGKFDKPDIKIMKQITVQIESSIQNVYQNSNYKKLPVEKRFYIRVNAISPHISKFIYKHNLYEYYSILKEKLKNFFNR